MANLGYAGRWRCSFPEGTKKSLCATAPPRCPEAITEIDDVIESSLSNAGYVISAAPRRPATLRREIDKK